MKDLKKKKPFADKLSTNMSASSTAIHSNQLRDSPNAGNLQPSSSGTNTPSHSIIVQSNELLSTSANVVNLHGSSSFNSQVIRKSSGNTTPSQSIGQTNQCLQSSFAPTTKLKASLRAQAITYTTPRTYFGASNPLDKSRNPSIVSEQAIQDAMMLYALPNGQLVSADQLIAGDNTFENDVNDTLSSSVHDDAAIATSDIPHDVPSSLLPNIALKIIKIEENQKAAEKRLANIEKGIAMILNALSIDESSGKTKGAPIYCTQGLDTQFKKITTVDELKAFEDNLRNPKFHAEKVR